MKRTGIAKLLSVLVMFMLLLAACAKPTGTPAATATKKPKAKTPLVVAYSNFSAKFSPFFADTAYDQDVVSMTGVGLLTTDRTGAIVYNAIAGEKHSYNGTEYNYTGIADVTVNYDEATDKTVYTWTIRNDVKFSDGHVMDADDIIFSYYVYADPNYNGSSSLYSIPIVGINNYRTQTSDEVFAKFTTLFNDIYAAGRDHVWASTDTWTEAQQTAAWAQVEQAWKDHLTGLIGYIMNNYTSYGPDLIGLEAADIDTDGEKTAFAMSLWGFANYADGKLTGGTTGTEWTLTGDDFPTLDDFYAEAYAKYEGDADAYFGTEDFGAPASVADSARASFISTEGPKDPSLGGNGIPNIAGIKKLSQTKVEVTVEGFDATAIYNLGITVSPLHYYGDTTKYDYANNKFGFTFNDLDSIRAKTDKPVGAGPYRFIEFKNKVVYFEANEYYYKGEPLTYYVQFKETLEADNIPGLKTAAHDAANPIFNNETVTAIQQANSNGEITGNVINTVTVDNLGYGYIGMNAATMNVAGVPDSDASKNLRRGFATLLAVYRDVAVDSYYGDRASVINYPISNTSWAAPQKTDADYEVAFSKNVNGEQIYTSGMSQDDKYAAALEAAKGFFLAAGYTWDAAGGKFTAAPEGAKLTYELIIPGEGQGDHPSYTLVTDVRDVLATIGITLVINDPADSNELWGKLDAGSQELWCAAWGATIDPDMYQIYYSNNIVGNPGSTESNHYHIQDAQLDQLIMDARKSDDQSFRKTTYKAALDIIINWAVEVPIYQRKNAFIFSAERIDLTTLTPDITTFWGWMNDIEKLQLKANQG